MKLCEILLTISFSKPLPISGNQGQIEVLSLSSFLFRSYFRELLLLFIYFFFLAAREKNVLIREFGLKNQKEIQIVLLNIN